MLFFISQLFVFKFFFPLGFSFFWCSKVHIEDNDIDLASIDSIVVIPKILMAFQISMQKLFMKVFLSFQDSIFFNFIILFLQEVHTENDQIDVALADYFVLIDEISINIDHDFFAE